MTTRQPNPETFAALTAARARIFSQIQAERGKQQAKWGPCQQLPDVPSRQYRQGMSVFTHHQVPRASEARQACQDAARVRECAWSHVLLEEVFEALEEAEAGNIEALKEELTQCAAVISQWLEDIELREQGK